MLYRVTIDFERVSDSFSEKLCVFLTELVIVAFAPLKLFDKLDFVGISTQWKKSQDNLLQRRVNETDDAHVSFRE